MGNIEQLNNDNNTTNNKKGNWNAPKTILGLMTKSHGAVVLAALK